MTSHCKIIAHRGYTLHYPENTLSAFRAALEAGADAVEMDVQIAADGTPMVIHDPDLERVSGRRGMVHEMDAKTLQQFSVHEPERLGEQFVGETIPTLRQACELLASLPGETLVFIEVKEETLENHQLPAIMQRIRQDSDALEGRRVIISYLDAAIQQITSIERVPVGWILPGYNTASLERAQTLEPEFLFCDRELLPSGHEPLEEGSWNWAVYEITDPAEALRLQQRGVHYLETMAVAELRRGMTAGS